MKPTSLLLLLILLLLAAYLCWLCQENKSIKRTGVTIAGNGVPEGFQGFKIAQISDFHNTRFGDGQRQILSKLEEIAPNIIVITGDLLDGRRTDLETAMEMVRGAVQVAPVYYVTGNHESTIPLYPELERQLREAGVTVLRNERVTLRRNGSAVTLLGLDDPRFFVLDEPREIIDQLLAQKLKELLSGAEDYTILLCHRPERFPLFCSAGINLVFTGHAHGGQVRLPLVGGLFAPHQGFFPKYTAGVHRSGQTAMVISRGLGNSLFPLRVNDPPEIVVATLQ